ncbi:MAG: FKBP-type peptidyl-prolyl cis-trans isomerase [Pirellulaceae bacterium]
MAQENVGEKPSPFKDKKQEASYALGLQIGENLKAAGFKLDLALLAKGLADVLEEGGKPQLEPEAAQAVIRQYHQELTMQAAAENKKKGEEYLAANKKKEGVKTLESGLQYKVLKSGTGASPKLSDEVTTHYAGTLIDGTKFDSSYDRGQPATFPVGGVIKGWTEALQLMKVGDKWQLYVPAELAYGEDGRPGIPPNSVLVFDVELLSIGE